MSMRTMFVWLSDRGLTRFRCTRGSARRTVTRSALPDFLQDSRAVVHVLAVPARAHAIPSADS
jgi:hypothetical protein